MLNQSPWVKRLMCLCVFLAGMGFGHIIDQEQLQDKENGNSFFPPGKIVSMGACSRNKNNEHEHNEPNFNAVYVDTIVANKPEHHKQKRK